jgi:ribosomal protein L30
VWPTLTLQYSINRNKLFIFPMKDCAMIKIRQIRSPIRRHYGQRLTLKALGLNKIGRVVYQPDRPETWGSIRKVWHLVDLPDVDLATLSKHRLRRPKKPEEVEDLRLTIDLLFAPRAIEVARFSKKEMRHNSPDFKLMDQNGLRGYCEVKSPWHDWALEFPTDQEPGEERVETRPSQAAPNLAGHIRKAAIQFREVNPDHTVPNILVIVNHAPRRNIQDLRMTLVGIETPAGGTLPLLPRQEQHQVWSDAQTIDLYVWINPETRTVEHLVPAQAQQVSQACDLLDITGPDDPI